jgi:hypothetical protein
MLFTLTIIVLAKHEITNDYLISPTTNESSEFETKNNYFSKIIYIYQLELMKIVQWILE